MKHKSIQISRERLVGIRQKEMSIKELKVSMFRNCQKEQKQNFSFFYILKNNKKWQKN